MKNHENIEILEIKNTGRFYTDDKIATIIANDIFSHKNKFKKDEIISILDPFCGDGRLVLKTLEIISKKYKRRLCWVINLWDIDRTGLEKAAKAIDEFCKQQDFRFSIRTNCGDSLLLENNNNHFDIIVTNPPWENLRHDKRDINFLSEVDRNEHIQKLKEYEKSLIERFPHSKPVRKSFGNNINLSRVGFELALNLIKRNGICGIVLPASFLNDQLSLNLRKFLFNNYIIKLIKYYPAEARLFNGVDQNFITLVVKNNDKPSSSLIEKFDKELQKISKNKIIIDQKILNQFSYSIPKDLSPEIMSIMEVWNSFPSINEFEDSNDLKLGREMDETGIKKDLKKFGKIRFIKGKDLKRFSINNFDRNYLNKINKEFKSMDYNRIVWRDVSRHTQKRRMKASIIPPGILTGNSINIAYCPDNDFEKLLIFLALINSIPFEFQVNNLSNTGHISLGTVRKVKIPDFIEPELRLEIITSVKKLLNKNMEFDEQLEVLVAKAFKLKMDDYKIILDCMNIDNSKKDRLLEKALWRKKKSAIYDETLKSLSALPNHVSPKLSIHDLEVASYIPEGGNWKNIPEKITSKRLETIRTGFKEGKGSRSTYYGRLNRKKPSYTITTYFHRPGNGCNLHYSENRVLSIREAARLQSFPDKYIFWGTKTSIYNQIGNAVPPLLAFQIAKQFKNTYQYIDLFCGAGGLSLGFKWANWVPLIGSDIDKKFRVKSQFSHQC